MEKLQNLEYDNFIDLLNYLESLSESDIPEEIEVFVEEKIQKFFPHLNAVQQLELSYIVKNRDRKTFELFKESYPELDIDPTGQSTPDEKQYWQLTENSLNSVYDLAVQDLETNRFIDRSYNKVNTQVYNAKTLACLKNMETMKYDNYIFHRKLFLDSSATTNKKMKVVEESLRKLGLQPAAFLINVIKYCHKRKEDYSIFLDHLFKRIEILSADKKLSSEGNREFLSNINSIIDKNNKLYETE
jgi:hypothetical protein